MVIVAAIALVVGLLGLLVWVGASLIGESVEGWSHVDPDVRFGLAGRFVVAGLIGFGMGGLSASYAGWPAPAAVCGALAGSGGALAATWYLGPSGAGRDAV